jgi:hypothetical protein
MCLDRHRQLSSIYSVCVAVLPGIATAARGAVVGDCTACRCACFHAFPFDFDCSRRHAARCAIETPRDLAVAGQFASARSSCERASQFLPVETSSGRPGPFHNLRWKGTEERDKQYGKGGGGRVTAATAVTRLTQSS